MMCLIVTKAVTIFVALNSVRLASDIIITRLTCALFMFWTPDLGHHHGVSLEKRLKLCGGALHVC
jgi:hypothetical protein